MLQDIAPNRYNLEYSTKQPKENAVILSFRRNKVLVTDGEKELFPSRKEYEAICENKKQSYQYLFRVEEREYFLAEQQPVLSEAAVYHYVTVKSLRGNAKQTDCFVASTAYHLYVWYRDNTYCGRCGEKMIRGEQERMLCCTSCKNMVYPKIAPAVIVGVVDGERILMTKYANRDYKKYALIAGFCEIGETAEDTVRREVMEEVGLRVKNIRYYKSQPWGFDSNLLFGYFADLDGEATIKRDEMELAVAEWRSREATAGMDDGISLTREMMGVFAAGKERW